MEQKLTLQRYLDDIEVQLRGRIGAHIVEYKGDIHEEALASAFKLLCDQFPVLRGRIRRDGKGYLLYVPPDHRPEIVVARGDETTLERQVQEPLDSSRTVAELLLIRDETQGFAGLRADHAIVDARCLVTMLDELWRIYSAIINGSSISIDPDAGLPSSPCGLMKERWGEILSETAAAHPAATPKVYRAHSRRIVLSEEDTTQLIAAARAQQTSVHALICGAILVALRALGEPTDPAAMACLSNIDLRNRLSPPVGATETTNLLSFHKAEVLVPLNGNPVTVGRVIKRQLDTAIERRELQPYDVQRFISTQVDSSLERHLSVVGVSNSGVSTPFVQPPGLTITDLWKPLPQRTNVPFAGYGVYTKGGRLHMRCVYPSEFFTYDAVEQLVKRTAAQLRDVGTWELV